MHNHQVLVGETRSGSPNAFYDYVLTNMKLKRGINFLKGAESSLVQARACSTDKNVQRVFANVHTSDDGVIPTFVVPNLVASVSDVYFTPSVLSAVKLVKSICSAG